tara:strand:+ start:2395 stop:3087 length:693 start_codon:yes stop_codon:yes gene_type:complete
MTLHDKYDVDDVVEKLKKAGWEDIYNDAGIQVSKTTQAKDVKSKDWFQYYKRWTVSHIQKGETVMDVGCGFGDVCWMAYKKEAKPAGIDISQHVIDSANKELPEITFRKMYAEKMDMKDNTYDVVVSNELLEHVPNPEIVVKECIRILKPKGKLIITVPILHNFGLNGKSKHINHWGFYEVMHLFEKFGENFKIYWLNKFMRTENPDDPYSPPRKKNMFGVIFIKDEVKK